MHKILKKQLKKAFGDIKKVPKEYLPFLKLVGKTYENFDEDRGTSEKEVQKSEELYNVLAKNTTDVVWTMNLRLQYTYISPSVEKMRGYTVEESMKQSPKDVTTPEGYKYSKNAFKEEFIRELKKGSDPNRVRALEIQEKRRDGSLFWAEIRMTFLRNEKGKAVGILGVTRDISERKIVESKVEESEEKYRELFQNQISGYALHKIITNKNGKPIDFVFIEVNDAFEKMTGLKRSEILEKKVTNILPGVKKDPAGWIKKYGKVALKGVHIKFEQYSENVGKWFSVSAYSPKKGYFITVFDDITYRKSFEQELLSEKKKFESLVNNIPNAVYTTLANNTGTVTFISERWGEWTGYSPEMFYKDPEAWPKSIHPDDRKDAVKKFVEAYSKNKPYAYEYRLVHKDTGRVRYVLDQGKPRKDKLGKVTMYDGIATDVTQVKEAKKEVGYSLSLLRSTLESTEDGILVVDRKGKFLVFNKQFSDMWKISKSVLKSGDYSKALSFVLKQLKDPDSFVEKVNELYKKINKESFDVLEFKDGRVVESYSTPQKIENKVVGRVWNFRDITKRKKFEDKMSEKNDELERMNNFMVGRELRMIELKKELEMLKKSVQKTNI